MTSPFREGRWRQSVVGDGVFAVLRALRSMLVIGITVMVVMSIRGGGADRVVVDRAWPVLLWIFLGLCLGEFRGFRVARRLFSRPEDSGRT